MTDSLSCDKCVICRTKLADIQDVCVVKRGKDTLIDFSDKYGDAELLD